MFGTFGSRPPTRPPTPAAMAAFRPSAARAKPEPKVEDLRARRDGCPQREQHTEPPEGMGYTAHMEWLTTMSRTHRQSACKGCQLFHVWTPKAATARRSDEAVPVDG